jgi:hypothetical protein
LPFFSSFDALAEPSPALALARLGPAASNRIATAANSPMDASVIPRLSIVVKFMPPPPGSERLGWTELAGQAYQPWHAAPKRFGRLTDAHAQE